VEELHPNTHYQLPPEVEEFRMLARKVCREELMPLEKEYLPHTGHALGMKESIKIKNVFGKDIAAHLEKVSRDTGLWYVMVPEQYGGMGISLLARAVILEELNYCAVPLPVAHVANILYACKGDQVEKYLKPVIEGQKNTSFGQTEPGAGSDPGGMMSTKAVRDGDDWIINGTKMWISMAHQSDFIMLQAVTDPAKRQRGGITMFLVDRDAPGLSIDPKGIKTWHGSAQYIVNLDNVRVPASQVLGEVGGGFSLGQQWLTIHDRLLRGPLALGKMIRGLHDCIEWSKQRVTFGKPISERQAIQWKLVDMYVKINALRAMIYENCAKADNGEDVRTQASLVKLTSADWGEECMDDCIQIHGAMGESLDLPYTLFYRLLRHTRIGGGTDEIQRMLIARALLK
jgi:acyl-CoA dehydrogenase